MLVLKSCLFFYSPQTMKNQASTSIQDTGVCHQKQQIKPKYTLTQGGDISHPTVDVSKIGREDLLSEVYIIQSTLQWKKRGRNTIYHMHIPKFCFT